MPTLQEFFGNIRMDVLFARLVVVIGMVSNVVALLAVGLALFGATKRSLFLAGLSLAYALFVVGLELMGTYFGMQHVEAILAVIDEDDRARLWEAGQREASVPRNLSFFFGAGPLVAALAAAIAAARENAKEKSA
ncbi:MAG: hypothetical protein GY822_00955 [Deltaproteobacteria bacterium]|nr:hypothetical protein [Deltaproteobacteria bacterium]